MHTSLYTVFCGYMRFYATNAFVWFLRYVDAAYWFLFWEMIIILQNSVFAKENISMENII